VFSYTFSNMLGVNQTYPDGKTNAPGTGASATNSLGYSITAATMFNDSVYHITVTFNDTSSTLLLTFSGVLTDTLVNEAWGIDNVRVVANP
jgi:hypothetical protein